VKTKARILLTLAGAFALYSCGENSNSESAAEANFEFSYTIDTVMVDAGEHFFFLNWGLGLSDVSADSKFLYNLNPDALQIEVVDLESLKLAEVVQLEKEGPNGVGGGYISQMEVLGNGNILLFDYNKISEITQQGELVRTYEFDKSSLSGYEFKAEDKIGGMGVFTPDAKVYAAPMEDDDFRKPASGLAIINTETNNITFKTSDAFSKLDEFRILLQMDGNAMMSTGETSFMDFIGEELILSNTAFNEVYRYNLKTDSLSHKTFTAKLTGNERIKNFQTEVDSQERLFEVAKEKNKQVRFEPMIPLPKENLIWRISQDLDRMIADSVIQKTVLTIFDADFAMLKELKLENFTPSGKSFFKDGMLYNFLNVDDELAFVRLKPVIGR
jgi:hypothetical protein